MRSQLLAGSCDEHANGRIRLWKSDVVTAVTEPLPPQVGREVEAARVDAGVDT